MTSVLRELPLSYAVLSEGRRCGSASRVHEPSPAGPSARATPPRRSPESSTPRVRLHLKPGQKGTKQLLAQYRDRLICVRYRYDTQRKKRFTTVELLVAERDWEPPRPRFAHDQIVGLAFTADPVGAGLVASLGRPGGNVTGVTTLAPALSAKRLEILKEAFPTTSRVAVLRFLGPDSAYARTADLFWKETERAGHALALPLLPVELADPNQYQRAFTAITRGRADAAITLGDFVLTTRQRIQIVELVLRHRLPAIYQGRGSVDVGGLISYGPNLPALHRRAAVYVDEILKGAKPSTLPIEQPTKFDLVISLKTAKALGLTIPQSLLLRAEQFIE
jgi:hypothetical protein